MGSRMGLKQSMVKNIVRFYCPLSYLHLIGRAQRAQRKRAESHCRVCSGCFQGSFRVFSSYLQGVFKVFSGCFPGVFPYVLAGYVICTLPTLDSLQAPSSQNRVPNCFVWGAPSGSCNSTLLKGILRRHLTRISAGVLRRVLRRGVL